MRFMTSAGNGGTQLHAITDNGAVLLSGTAGIDGDDLRCVIDGGAAALDAAAKSAASGEAVSVSSLTPAMPITKPGKIVCLGLNYLDHAKEGGYDMPDYPAMFLRVASSMIPAEAPMIAPNCSVKLDYEAELMVIIGKGGKHIAEADALAHVFGYTLFNDGSVRDYQRKTHQWTPGKNFDATGAVGPVVVTPDELPAGASGLRIQSRLNSNVMQDSNTSDMMFPVAQTIATLSEFMTLEPGDMIAMGTPPGVGHARKPPVFMKDGDTVEIEIEGIGVLRNPVVAESK
jgi:2-keto-4-pentenoate hydratase/2-oxohepta-3-ene-1,7-dioic acid hydratase in catechol pathway